MAKRRQMEEQRLRAMLRVRGSDSRLLTCGAVQGLPFAPFNAHGGMH